MRLWLARMLAGDAWPTAVSAGAPTPLAPQPWYPSVSGGELRLGEIITGLKSYRFRGLPDGTVEVEETQHDFVMVGTPECDLLQAHKSLRENRKLKISGVLFFEVEEETIARQRIPINSAQWNFVKTHRIIGLQHLTEFSPATDFRGEQIPNLVIDFKRHFTLPLDEVYRQFDLPNQGARRRCYPGDTWRENIQQRAQASMGRVGTPAADDML